MNTDNDERLYLYRWGNNPARAKMKGRVCRVLARGAKNSVAIEFIDNGERTLTSRNALKQFERLRDEGRRRKDD